MGDETTNETGSEAQRPVSSAIAAPPNAERWLSAWATFLIAVPLMLFFMVNENSPDDFHFGMMLLPLVAVLYIMLILGAAFWISAVLLVVGETAYRLIRRQPLDAEVSPFFLASSTLVIAYGLWIGWHVWI